MSKRTLDDLRRTVGSSEPERRMLAAIEAAARGHEDDLAEIAAALMGAYVTVAHASGHGEQLLRMAASGIEATLRDMAAARRAAPRGQGN
jgi:predicted neutral ceramidase superfamily lipid hydrolase